jgi:hypothetical protein
MPTYAGLEAARTELKVEPDKTADNGYIRQALEFVTARIDKMTGISFFPRFETRYFDAYGDHIDDEVLTVDFPLLGVSSISVGDTVVDSPVYQLHPRGRTPFREIVRLSSYWSYFGSNWRQAIAVSGIWGYRTRYPNEAWLSVDTLQAGINASVTAYTVLDVDGANAFGYTPRIDVGNLARIGTEYLDTISTVAGTTNAVNDVRGILGSTAAAHDNGTAVDIWRPEPDIVRACLRWADYLYSRRGEFSKVTFDGVATVVFPPDAPEEVENIINPYFAFNKGFSAV